jgi:hypothetical protein
MRCANCDTELSPGARFCGRCGVTIEERKKELPSEPVAAAAPAGASLLQPVGGPDPGPIHAAAGVLLLEAPRDPQPSPPEPRVDLEPAPAIPEHEAVAEPEPGRTTRRLPASFIAVAAAAVVVGAAILGAFQGHQGVAAANAEAAALRARLADAATAQAALAGQLATANGRLKAQKATEPLRRLVGKRAGELQSYMQSHGWQLRVVKVASTRPAGTVLSQSLPPGHPMKPGAVIVVHVAA